MVTRTTPSPQLEQQERSFFLFVVVVGYIITFSVSINGGEQYTIARLLIGIGCGVVYLVLGFFEAELLRRFSPAVRNAVYFSLQLTLVFGIGWELGPGGSWLIGLPLAGIAVEKLSARARWPVYLILLAAVILPILRYSTWDTALMNGLVISTAILFVVLFTQFRLDEQQARRRAEELATQLESANHKLAEYASQVEELTAMRERNRLARDIHDNLGHYLTIANVQIEAAKITFDTDSRQTREALDKAQDYVKKGLASVRESVSTLRVSPVEARSLQDAIAALIDEMWLSEIRVQWNILGAPIDVDEKIALVVYRAAQEGLTNIRKHANATLVNVLLDFSQVGELRLSIRDNGIGAADTSGGFGLIGIHERIHLLGGKCRIETQPGKGFCLEVALPLIQEEAV